MKAFLNLSYILLITVAICFGIAGGYISAQSLSTNKTNDIENRNHQGENTLQNNFSFDDEEYQNDTIIDAVSNYSFKNNYSINIFPLIEFIPNSYLSVIWQPPKI